MPQHVMIDLETLGTDRDSIVLSIGAAKFDPHGDGVDEAFEVFIDPVNADNAGFTMSAATTLWWMQSDRDEARNHLLAHKDDWVDVGSALDLFRDWFGFESMPVWGNSAAFDNEILKTYFKKVNMDVPWEFWDDRCYRTLKNIAPHVELERVGTYHSAIDDAVSQAAHLQEIVRELELKF